MTKFNEEFVKALYSTVVKEGLEESKEMYETTEITPDMSDFWRKALSLYQASDLEGKETLMQIMEQTMIDTISLVLGVIDGSSTLDGTEIESKLFLDSHDTENELQDEFLMFMEENDLYP